MLRTKPQVRIITVLALLAKHDRVSISTVAQTRFQITICSTYAPQLQTTRETIRTVMKGAVESILERSASLGRNFNGFRIDSGPFDGLMPNPFPPLDKFPFVLQRHAESTINEPSASDFDALHQPINIPTFKSMIGSFPRAMETAEIVRRVLEPDSSQSELPSYPFPEIIGSLLSEIDEYTPPTTSEPFWLIEEGVRGLTKTLRDCSLPSTHEPLFVIDVQHDFYHPRPGEASLATKLMDPSYLEFLRKHTTPIRPFSEELQEVLALARLNAIAYEAEQDELVRSAEPPDKPES